MVNIKDMNLEEAVEVLFLGLWEWMEGPRKYGETNSCVNMCEWGVGGGVVFMDFCCFFGTESTVLRKPFM